MVSNDRFGLYLRMGHGSPKKRFRTGPIPFVTQKYINDLPVLVDGAIEVEFLLAAKAEHFIHRPLPSDPPPVLTERSG
jgi:hypothetical protein